MSGNTPKPREIKIDDLPAETRELTEREQLEVKGGLMASGGLHETTSCETDSKQTGHYDCDA